MNMKNWINTYRTASVKKALPILSFPSSQLLGITVKELISDSVLQSDGMKLIADRCPSAASVSMMDLSVEAEAFGSVIRTFDNDVPSVTGSIVNNIEEARALRVPVTGSGRTGIYVETAKRAKSLITDRPVLAGVIGPFSLAGRLMDVTETMIYCYEEPDFVKEVMEKTTSFLISYILEYKKAGADGVVMAEPLTGLLSPELAAEFSCPYVKRIISAVQDDNFIVIYHNCGNNTVRMLDSILTVGASAYHFGNAINIKDILEKAPRDIPILGNIDPVSQFRNGTPESMKTAVNELLSRCSEHSNFIISSGCDIPPLSSWQNIDAFFSSVTEYYENLPK